MQDPHTSTHGAPPRSHRVPALAITLAALSSAAGAQGGAPSAGAGARLPSASTIRAILADRVGSKRSAGIVVGVLDRGGRRVVAYGRSDGPGSRPLDGASVFEIGSVTKVFTTTLLAEMAERGDVRLDDPVAKHLPASVMMPARDGKQITLLDLATQTSGLPRLPGNLTVRNAANPYADYTVQNLYDFLSGYALTRGVGEQFEYSNLGLGLLGHALAQRAGTSYEALVTERILRPLRMRDTRITLTREMRARLAVGHNRAGNSVGLWDLPTLAGAGALRSTANDMLVWVAANLDTTGRTSLARAMRAAQRPRRLVTPPNVTPTVEIGLGWLTVRRSGRDVVWHNGGTGGYHSFVGLDPARGAGVVVLSNSATDIDDIGMHLLDERVPLAGAAPAKNRVAIALDTAVFDAYVGRYELVPGFVIAVTREGSRFFVQATGQPKVELFAESPTEFFLRVVDAQITFVKGADGRVNELILHQGGMDQRARRVE